MPPVIRIDIVRIAAALTRAGRKKRERAIRDNKSPTIRPTMGKYKRDAPKSFPSISDLIFTGNIVKNCKATRNLLMA